MFVVTPIIMDSPITNFRGWENFVTAKSTTKITKISTPRKLPTIQYSPMQDLEGIDLAI